jgi:pilus assembly protein CpaC
VIRTKLFARNVLATSCACLMLAPPMTAAEPVTPAEAKAAAQDQVTKQATPNGVVGQLTVTVGKSLAIDSPLPIKRLSYANGAMVEAQAIGPKEVLLNGKAPGETSLIIWQDDGTRLIYDLTVRVSPQRLNAVRQQIARDYPDADVNVTFDNDAAFVRGTVKDVTTADRIMAMVTTISPAKPVNLLKVEVPAVEPQILLKVRFANVDRSASIALGFNFASTAFNQTTALGTGSSILPSTAAPNASSLVGQALGTAVNIFALRTDINLLTEIQALESKNLLEMLAEPNLLTYSGTRASFTAGGEFPYLTPQPTAGGTIFSIEFKPYGVLLNFLPRVTPQGTIHMQINPEVSALDYTNTVTIQGTAVPGLTTRKVSSEVDLESGQTFIIAGMLDKQITEAFNKIPGLGDIPILGKLFQSKTITKSNSELMIIITPEIVRPIPSQQPVPELKWTVPFMSDNSPFPMRQPGMDSTGPVPVHPPVQNMPLEQLLQQQKLIAPAPITTPLTVAPAAAPPAAPPGGAGNPAAPAGSGGNGNGSAAPTGNPGGGNGN